MRRRDPRPAVRHHRVAALGPWAAINVPGRAGLAARLVGVLPAQPSRPADPDSLWFVVSYFTGWPGFDGELAAGETPTLLNAVVAALYVAVGIGLVLLVRRAPRPPRLASLAFLLVAAFLLVNKVWSPQYSLWLVPLAVLALPRWRLLLAWMTLDALLWVPRMYYYLGPPQRACRPTGSSARPWPATPWWSC